MEPDELIEEALKLKVEQRSLIVDRLLDSLDEADPEIDRLWADEAVYRSQAVAEERMSTHALDDVLAEVRNLR